MNDIYLTINQPGIGGRLKVKPEDFVVEEVPLYLPSGEGQHVYVEIEKTGLSTYAAIKAIAQALNISRQCDWLRRVEGCSGHHPQTLSIEGVMPEAVAHLNLLQHRRFWG